MFTLKFWIPKQNKQTTPWQKKIYILIKGEACVAIFQKWLKKEKKKDFFILDFIIK